MVSSPLWCRHVHHIHGNKASPSPTSLLLLPGNKLLSGGVVGKCTNQQQAERSAGCVRFYWCHTPASSVSCNRVAEMWTAGQNARAPTPEEKRGFQRRLEVPTVTLPGLITRTAQASGLIMRCGKEQEIYLRNCRSAGFLRTFPSRQSDPRFASTAGPSLSPTFAIPSWEQRA